MAGRAIYGADNHGWRCGTAQACHSSTPGCAAALEQIVRDAGGPEGLFQNLHIGSSKVAGIIADDRVVAVTITGNEYAGDRHQPDAGFGSPCALWRRQTIRPWQRIGIPWLA